MQFVLRGLGIRSIVSHCEGFAEFPYRGRMHDDIRPGLRVASHRKRTVIAFTADDTAETVSILGNLYGGHGHESALADDDGEP